MNEYLRILFLKVNFENIVNQYEKGLVTCVGLFNDPVTVSDS